MPTLNGYEACRRIRERSFGAKAIRIALSGWGQEDETDAYLKKHGVFEASLSLKDLEADYQTLQNLTSKTS